MPKYCVSCKETKSKSLFFKGKIVCKKCQDDVNTQSIDETSSIAPTMIDESNANILATINTISEKLSLLEKTSQDISVKLDTMSKTSIAMSDLSTTLDSMVTKMQDIPVVLDMLQNLPKRLDALERRVASIERTNIAQAVLKNQITDESCKPM